MEKNTKGIIDLFNSLEVYEQNGGDSPYCLVELTEEVIEEFEEVGISKEELDRYMEKGDDKLDLVYLGFVGGYVDYWDGTTFSLGEHTIGEVTLQLDSEKTEGLESVTFKRVGEDITLEVETYKGMSIVPITQEDLEKLTSLLNA